MYRCVATKDERAGLGVCGGGDEIAVMSVISLLSSSHSRVCEYTSVGVAFSVEIGPKLQRPIYGTLSPECHIVNSFFFFNVSMKEFFFF